MTFLDRIAGAPITWGVDGSPGWGHLMDRERVLREMKQIGLSATELGPDGYLGSDPTELLAVLNRHELELVGGFVPAVLYRPELIEENLDYVARAVATLASNGAPVMVLGPDSHFAGYDRQVALNEQEWDTFFHGLQRTFEIASNRGLRTALHPHWGMAVVTQAHVEKVLERSEVELCIDTGHLALAGADPVDVAEAAVGRVAHVHLKDLDESLARQVRSGDLPFRQAVINGLFLPLGEGSVDISRFIQRLEDTGFEGWYVIEQDIVLNLEPKPDEGPLIAALSSVRFLEEVARKL